MLRVLLLSIAVLNGACAQVDQLELANNGQAMRVLLPPDDGRERPGVLLVHGGGWSGGSLAEFDFAARRLAASGYVTLNIDYRLAPAAQFPAAVQDVSCALASMRAHAEAWHLDPHRIAALGYSAGGHLVSLLATAFTEPELNGCGVDEPPAVVVSGAGPHDLRLMSAAGPVIQFLGTTIEQDGERFAFASPITHVTSQAPPFLLIAGTADWYVPWQQQQLMAAALQTKGVEVHLLSLAGGGHVSNPAGGLGDLEAESSFETAEGWAATIDFLDSHLKRGAP